MTYDETEEQCGTAPTGGMVTSVLTTSTSSSSILQVSPYSSGTVTTPYVYSSPVTISGISSVSSGSGTLNLGINTEIGREFLEGIVKACEKHPDLAQRFYDALLLSPIHNS